jgi:hypothetical protein
MIVLVAEREAILSRNGDDGSLDKDRDGSYSKKPRQGSYDF